MQAPSITVSWMCATPFSSTLILRSFAQASGSINRGVTAQCGKHFFRGLQRTGLLTQRPPPQRTVQASADIDRSSVSGSPASATDGIAVVGTRALALTMTLGPPVSTVRRIRPPEAIVGGE